MNINNIILYPDQYESIKMLNHEEMGCLFESIFEYAINGKINNDLSPVVKMAFSFFRVTMDIDRKKYLLKCEKNRDHAKKRWQDIDLNADASERIHLDANDTNNKSSARGNIKKNSMCINTYTKFVNSPIEERRERFKKDLFDCENLIREYDHDFLKKFEAYYECPTKENGSIMRFEEKEFDLKRKLYLFAHPQNK